jgi:hypothetical protein
VILSFSIWLILFNMMIFSSIHFPTANIVSFLLYSIFFIHSSVGRHLGRFHSSATVSSASVTTDVQGSLLHGTYTPLDTYPALFLILRSLHTIFIVAALIYILTNSV